MPRKYTFENPRFGNVPQQKVEFDIPNEGEVFSIDKDTYGVLKGGKVYEFGAPLARAGVRDRDFSQSLFNPVDIGASVSADYNRANLLSAFGSPGGSYFAPATRDLFQGLQTQQSSNIVKPTDLTPVEAFPGQFGGVVRASGVQSGGGVAQPASMPLGRQISNETDLQAKRQELAKAGVPAGEWNKFISSPDAQGRLFYAQPATLTGPTGQKKVVASGSKEASDLLKAGWTLGGAKSVGGTILTSNDLVDEPSIDLGTSSQQNTYPVTPVQSTIAASVETSKSINDYLNMIKMPETDASRQSSELTARVNELLGETAGQSQALAQEEERLGVRKLQETLTSINNEIGIKTAALNKRLAEIEATPMTLARQSGAEAAARRVAQADIMFLQASAQAAMNNISFAKETAQAGVNQKYNPILEELNIKLKQLDIVNSSLNKDEAKYADALKLYLQDRQSAISEQKKTQSDISSVIMEVVANNPSIAKDRIIDQMKNAGSAVEAMQIAGQLATGTGYQYVTTPAELTKFRNAGYEIVNLGGRMYARKPDVVAASGGSRSGGSRVSGGVEGTVSNLTQSIIDNPSLFDDLTPTNRGIVLSELQANGYDTSNLGVKSLSDTAIKEISQTQKALSDLADLRAKIEGNLEFVGPIKGLQKLNPYSKARRVQADIDRVKQTVGKALEGGVLRKEDEEKYKKILATITDTPDTALYKIDALINSIQRDIETYKSLQQSGGRSMDVQASLQKKGATPITQEDLRKKYNY